MNMCIHGTITTGVDTGELELSITWRGALVNFAPNGNLLILEIMNLYGCTKLDK